MMSSAAWRVSCLIASPRHTRLAIWRHPVGSPRTLTVFHKWSIGPTLHYSLLSARLACHDGAAYPHVLQVIMSFTSSVLEPREHALETREPNCIGRSAMPFFILEARGP
jgi:hypothetical protein